VNVTPAVRDFLAELEELVDREDWPALDRETLSVTPGSGEVLVRLPHAHDHTKDIELVVDDKKVFVTYAPEHIEFWSRKEALQFVEMLGRGRVTLDVHRGFFWTTMRSYRDGLAQPFRRTRIPWFNARPRTERIEFGFRAG
jgi:hypothetical protein